MVPGYLRQWVGIVNRSGNRNVYDGNRVEGCPYAGILVLDHSNTVVNNVIVGCKTGVLVAYREFGATPATNTPVHHNTIINSSRAVQVEPRCRAEISNNLFFNDRRYQAPAIVGAGTGVFPLVKLDWSLFRRFEYTQPGVIHASHNLYWNIEPGYLRNFEGGHFGVEAEPRFIDAARGDYRLRADSPAGRAGRSLGIGHDANGRPRPVDRPSLGAFQVKRE